NGRAPVQLGHGAEIDGKRKADLLALAQAQARSSQKHAGSAQIHRLAEPALATWQQQVDGGTCPMSCMQPSFHSEPTLLKSPTDRRAQCMPRAAALPTLLDINQARYQPLATLDGGAGACCRPVPTATRWPGRVAQRQRTGRAGARDRRAALRA